MKYNSIHIIRGSIPVLISAPHTRPIAQWSDGGKRYIKPKEIRIAKLLKKMCRETGSWGIYIDGTGVIKSWEEKWLPKYKKIIRETIRTNNIFLFIDIHGSHESRPFLIDYDFKIPKKHPDDYSFLKTILLKKLAEEGFSTSSISHGFFSGLNGISRGTLSYYARRYINIPSLQLEISKKIRLNNIQVNKFARAMCRTISEYHQALTKIQ